jgi:hypothetical protein
MIRPIPWHRLPSEPIRDALPILRWQVENDTPPSAGIAALMLYVTLNFIAHKALAADEEEGVVAEATYTKL